MRCIVVDDEPLALEMMASYVRKTPYLELCGAFGSSLEALEFLRNNAVELAFMDIQMPDLNGLELGERVAGSGTRIVFVTAYEQYALQGFKVEALDYLLKPVGYNDFLKAAERARRWFEHESIKTDPEKSDVFFVRADYRRVKIRLCDILYIESVKDYVKIHLDPAGKSRQETPGANFCIMTLQSMRALEEVLPKDNFLRVHRCFIVNLNQIQSVAKDRVTFADDKIVPVSETYKPLLDERIAKFSLFPNTTKKP